MALAVVGTSASSQRYELLYNGTHSFEAVVDSIAEALLVRATVSGQMRVIYSLRYTLGPVQNLDPAATQMLVDVMTGIAWMYTGEAPT